MGKARDVMTPDVEVVSPDQTVQFAAKLMAERNLGALPVCDTDRRLRGMLTDRDIAVRVVASGKDPSATKVGEVTENAELVTIGADDSLDEALRTMKEHRVRRLPVIDGHDLVGMISQGDLATGLPKSKAGDLVQAITAGV